MKLRYLLKISLISISLTQFISAAQAEEAMSPSKGIGPIKTLDLKPIDNALADSGEKLFKTKCSACHKIPDRYIGPALLGVTHRRKPEWIMNMILNPVEMTQKDPVAMDLFGSYNMVQMTFQSVSESDARSILEFFRRNDEGSGGDKAKADVKPAKEATPAKKEDKKANTKPVKK